MKINLNTCGLLLMLQCCIPSLGFSSVTSSELDWFYKGNEACELHKHNEAISCYTKSLQINPNYAIAQYYRGILYFNNHKYNEAIADFTKVLTYQDDMVQACVESLERYREEGDGAFAPVCNRGGESFNFDNIYANINSVKTKLNLLSEKPYFKSKPKAVSSGDKLLNKLKSDLTFLLSIPDFASVYFYRGLAYGYLNNKVAVFADFDKAKDLGFDFETVKTENLFNKTHLKYNKSVKSTKITKEDIQFINSLNYVERTIFHQTFILKFFEHYLDIVHKNPKSSMFLNGWINRISDK